MKKKHLLPSIFALSMMFNACQFEQKSGVCDFCNQTMDYKIFENKMMVGFTYINPDHTLDKKYGCPPIGAALFPSIEFSGIPEGSTHLHIELVDATCSYGCNSCCQFKHCVLEFPLSALKDKNVFNFNGIKDTGNPNLILKKYLLKNSAGKHEFFPFCPPPFQTHAYYIRMTAFKLNKDGKKTMIAKTQSTPALLWSEKEVKAYKRLAKPGSKPLITPKSENSTEEKTNDTEISPVNPNKPEKKGPYLIEPIKKTKPQLSDETTAEESKDNRTKKRQLTFKKNSWE